MMTNGAGKFRQAAHLVTDVGNIFTISTRFIRMNEIGTRFSEILREPSSKRLMKQQCT